MRPRTTGILLCLCFAVLLTGAAHAVGIDVDARCNIFGASHLMPPATPDSDSAAAGIMPVYVPLDTIPGQFVWFPSVTGLVGCCGTLTYNLGNGPEGGHNASGTTDITSIGGIAGIIDQQHTMFLVGVFTTDSEAVDPAPDRLDFSDTAITEHFKILSPQLDQVFFIGDGLESEGVGGYQGFNVPVGATKLWFGFADSHQFGDPSGPPEAYDDNMGSIHAEVQVVQTNSPSVAGVSGAGAPFAMRPTLGDPRRGGCEIRFTLPAAQPVTVTMYDVSGRRVRELARGLALSAGNAEVAWDGRDAAGAHVRGGVYFARVSCPAGVGTARVFAIP